MPLLFCVAQQNAVELLLWSSTLYCSVFFNAVIILVLLLSLPLHAQRLAGGGRHSLAICGNGNVIAWGYNGYGQVGVGGPDAQPSGVTVHGLEGANSVSGGLFHSLVVLDNGTVRAFGRNSRGQLGDGTTIDRSMPVQVLGIPNTIQTAGGGEHSLFLSSDGTAWACGLNTSGQLGDGTRTNRLQPVRVSGLENIIQVAAGAEYSLFLDGDGNVWACGHNGNSQFGNGLTTSSNVPVRIAELQDVAFISAGEWHSLFVLRNGSVYGSGSNMLGQIGSDTVTEKHRLVRIEFPEFIVHADAGGMHSVFVAKSGTVYACGLNSMDNNNGQLGDGTAIDRRKPVLVVPTWGERKVEYAYASREHSLFLLDDGVVYACGRNNYGQLGTGRTQLSNALSAVNASATCVTTSVRDGVSGDGNLIRVAYGVGHISFVLPKDVLHGSLTVMDLQGRIVSYNGDFQGGTVALPTLKLPTGCYVVRIVDDQSHLYGAVFVLHE